MNRYILDPRDHIRLVPPDKDGPGSVVLMCERTMIWFELEQMERGAYLEDVPAADGPCRGLCFVCDDALMGQKQEVCVPESHADYPQFAADMEQYLPRKVTLEEGGSYVKDSCDQTGSHHHHN